MRKLFASTIEIVEVALIAVAAVFLIRNFLVQPFLVSGASMVPTFMNGDYLLVDEFTYHFRVPERGEVIVFRNPNDESVYFIKRVVGLPGERIRVLGGAVTIFNKEHPDGFALQESYLPSGTETPTDRDITLKSGEYFMMGDNRLQSYDSRSWGPMPAKDIIGLVRLRLWPLATLRAFAAPKYEQ